MSFLLKFLFQLSKPIAVITVPLIFTKCSFLISLYAGQLVITGVMVSVSTKLQQDCQSKSSLRLLSTTSLEMGKTHIVWDSINNSVRDVRKAITKARMLTGTCMLQTLKSKFNQAEVDPTCLICRLETETTSWHIMSFLLKFLFQLSKPIAVITLPLIFTKCSFQISLYAGQLVIT
jgi:hypothetical protein